MCYVQSFNNICKMISTVAVYENKDMVEAGIIHRNVFEMDRSNSLLCINVFLQTFILIEAWANFG